MASVVITESAVLPGAEAVVLHGFADDTVRAGDAVYFFETVGRWRRAMSNAIDKGGERAQRRGIALNHAYYLQPVSVCVFDPAFTIGGALVKGESYWVAATSAGKIVPTADLLSGNFRIHVGTAVSTTELALEPYSTGATG